jgi:hypothetical protein
MVSRQDIQRYRANLRDELNSAALYRSLAANEENEELVEVTSDEIVSQASGRGGRLSRYFLRREIP